jgi:ketosteroid isomerase-like protein
MSTKQHEDEWTGVGDLPADDDFAAALERERSATARTVHGDSTEFKALCTHADDVSLAGRGGGFECGWADVSARYDWVAGQYLEGQLEHRLLASGHSGDLGYSFELVSGRVRFLGAEVPVPVAVRVTHVWRREADGWKLLHRHADQLSPKVEHLADIDQSWLDDEQAQRGVKTTP